MAHKAELREEVRIAYASGMLYKDLIKKYGLQKSTISNWCSDLARRKREKNNDNRVMAEYPYEGYILYIRLESDGMKRARLFHSTTRQTHCMSLGRYLMSVKERRILGPHEIVKRISEDNDNIESFVLTTKDEIRKEAALKKQKTCIECNKTFTPSRPNGFLCSKPCDSSWRKKQPSRKQKKIYKKICLICDSEFEAKSHLTEVCFGKECRAVIRRYSRTRR